MSNTNPLVLTESFFCFNNATLVFSLVKFFDKDEGVLTDPVVKKGSSTI